MCAVVPMRQVIRSVYAIDGTTHRNVTFPPAPSAIGASRPAKRVTLPFGDLHAIDDARFNDEFEGAEPRGIVTAISMSLDDAGVGVGASPMVSNAIVDRMAEVVSDDRALHSHVIKDEAFVDGMGMKADHLPYPPAAGPSRASVSE